jgi:hypothetical protein
MTGSKWLKIYWNVSFKKITADAAWKNYAPNKKNITILKNFSQKKDND